MLQTLRNAWKIEELRKKILFTLVIILLYRLGNAIPVPDVNIALLNAYFAQPLDALNVSVLDKFEDGAVVDVQAILDAGIISKCKYGIKFLGNGEVTKKLTVKAAAFSETAKQKIEAAGGKAEVV